MVIDIAGALLAREQDEVKGQVIQSADSWMGADDSKAPAFAFARLSA